MSDSWICRCAGGLGDLAEAGAAYDVGRQAHIDNVEEVEEFATKLQIDPLCAALAPAEWRVLDEREVEVIVGRSAEGVSPQGSKAPLIRACTSGRVNGNGKECGYVIHSLAEVVFAHRARSGEMRLRNLVGPIYAIGARTCLLNS